MKAYLSNVGLACDIPYEDVPLNALVVGLVAGQHWNAWVQNGHKTPAAVVQPLHKFLRHA